MGFNVLVIMMKFKMLVTPGLWEARGHDFHILTQHLAMGSGQPR